jgi:hypothetical protein
VATDQALLAAIPPEKHMAVAAATKKRKMDSATVEADELKSKTAEKEAAHAVEQERLPGLRQEHAVWIAALSKHVKADLILMCFILERHPSGKKKDKLVDEILLGGVFSLADWNAKMASPKRLEIEAVREKKKSAKISKSAVTGAGAATVASEEEHELE